MLGLQLGNSLQKYFVGCVVTKEKIAEAKAVYDAHLGPGIFNEEGWVYVN